MIRYMYTIFQWCTVRNPDDDFIELVMFDDIDHLVFR